MADSREPITLAQVAERLRRIEERAAVGDNETAHHEEDRLHRDVLALIAASPTSPHSDLAKEALSSEEIEFSRWYA